MNMLWSANRLMKHFRYQAKKSHFCILDGVLEPKNNPKAATVHVEIRQCVFIRFYQKIFIFKYFVKNLIRQKYVFF